MGSSFKEQLLAKTPSLPFLAEHLAAAANMPVLLTGRPAPARHNGSSVTGIFTGKVRS
jgi:hypothetical protein